MVSALKLQSSFKNLNFLFQFFESIIEKILFIFRARRCFCAFKGLYCLDLRLGVKDLFMHKKHSLRALNMKITILNQAFLIS
jgi:hypothetical protein